MKKIRFYISIFIIILWITPFTSFWQTCKTCYSTPEWVSSIISFITEILGEINTIWNTDPYVGQYVSPKLYESGQFQAPKKLLISKYLKHAQENLWMIAAIQRTSLRLGDATSFFDSFMSRILVRNKSSIRDYQRVQELDKRINKKKYELSLGRWREDAIWWVTFTKIENIFAKYKELWVLKQNSDIAEWAKYWDLLLVLWRLSDSLWHFVSITATTSGGKWLEKTKKNRFTKNIQIQIHEKLIEEINNDYTCTRFRKCESTWTDTLEELKKIWSIFSGWRINFTQEIVQSTQRLIEAYSRSNLKKTLWTEQAMVQDVYKFIKKTNDYRKAMIKNIKKESKSNELEKPEKLTKEEKKIKKELEKQLKETDKLAEKERKRIEKELKEIFKKEAKEDAKENFQNIIKSNIENPDSTNTLSKKLTNIWKSVINAEMKSKEKYKISDPNDILIKIVALSERINYIIAQTIWSKDSDLDCLVKNLWILCEKQCGNIPKTCYY